MVIYLDNIMKYIYEEYEREILEEKPYNWKKHFIFQIPEMLTFFIKWLIILAIIKIVVFSLVLGGLSVITDKETITTIYNSLN